MITLTVLGVTISVDSNTRFEVRAARRCHMFCLEGRRRGDTVLVRGLRKPAGSGMVLAPGCCGYRRAVDGRRGPRPFRR